MVRYRPPTDWQQWVDWLAAGLHGRSRWRLSVLLMGILFACGRRTVTTWLRAAGIHADFADFDYLIALDRGHLGDLRYLARSAGAEVALLMDFAPDAGTPDVPDPYYDGRFAEVYELVEQGCRGLLEHIARREGLEMQK